MAVSLTISIDQNSQSITKNTSNVTVGVRASWTNGSYNLLEKSGYVIIDGTKYAFTSPFNTSKTSSGTVLLYSKTLDIKHGSDGKKTLSCSASYTTGVSSGTIAATASKALTTIARKSTLSVANGTLGTAQTLTITRQSTSLTHSIKAQCGSSTLYIKADGSTSTTESKHSDCSIPFTPPLSWARQNTSGKSVSVTYTITTYSGNASLGSNSYTKTFDIPSSVAPTVSIAVDDALGYADTYGGYIKGLSKFHIALTAAGAYGSTINTYKTTADGKTYTDADFTTGVISGKGTLTINATVTDSRNRSDTDSETVTVLDYKTPSLSVSVKRCNEDGSSNSSGGYLAVSFNVTVTALNNKNTASYKIEYKKSSDPEYTEIELTEYANQYTAEGVFIFAAETSSTYNIKVTIIDAFNSVSKTVLGASVFKLFSSKKGLGWAFGKICELVGYLDIAFKTRFRDQAEFTNDKSIMGIDTEGEAQSALIPVSASGNTSLGFGLYKAGKGNTHLYGNKIQFYTNDGIYTNGNKIYFDNNIGIYGTKPDGRTFEAFNPQNANGNVVVGWDNYDLQDGNTHIYGHDLNFGVSNIANPGTYRPYIRRGTSLTTTIRTSGYVTNAKKDVYFFIPFARPIIGSPTVTVTSGDGFVLRQNNKYTHGSAADGYVTPDSYTVSSQLDIGVFIKVTFSDTTNVINNSPIGIQWNGTITFS